MGLVHGEIVSHSTDKSYGVSVHKFDLLTLKDCSGKIVLTVYTLKTHIRQFCA